MCDLLPTVSLAPRRRVLPTTCALGVIQREELPGNGRMPLRGLGCCGASRGVIYAWAGVSPFSNAIPSMQNS